MPFRQVPATLALILFIGASALGESPPGIDSGFPAGPAITALVCQGDAAEAQFDPERALQLYLQAEAARPNDAQLLLKIAREYSDSTVGMADPAEGRRRIERALDFSKRAAGLEPRSEVALLSIAICYGKLGLYCDTREKIGYVRLVKDYTDQALAVNPDYAYAHHVLGQWEYEVASLGRTKLFLVNLVYGGLPEASTEDAVRQLEIAVRLEPNTASHRLALGFAYLANGEQAKARRSFEEVLAMPRREFYDADCHKQAERAIASL